MKKELFDKAIATILAAKEHYSSYKLVVREEFESHTFGHFTNTDLAEAKELFKTKGYLEENVHKEAVYLKNKGKLENMYLTMLYSKDKDKISISVSYVGFGYATSKSRYYPLNKKVSSFAWTKHMYNLQPQGRGRFIPNPRIQLGSITIPGFSTISSIITKIFFQINYIPSAQISYRHYAGTQNEYEAAGKMFGVKIPEALKKFSIHDVIMLYKTIKDYNQINTLCQFLAKNDKSYKHDGMYTNEAYYDLFEAIAKMLFEDVTYAWLVRDYIGDNLSLKTRNISFKVKSIKRWQDEHRKASMERMMKGIREINPNERYAKALDGLEHPYEFITKKKRLLEETLEMQHCVATYANKINSGSCGIFSIMYNGKRYTLEVGFAYNTLIAVQLKGFQNRSAPPELLESIQNLLVKNSKNLSLRKKEDLALDIL